MRKRMMQAISIAGAAREFGLKREQVKYLIAHYSLQPIDPPSGADRRCRWYRKRDIHRAAQLTYTPFARAS